jgi:hypothetical protein
MVIDELVKFIKPPAPPPPPPPEAPPPPPPPPATNKRLFTVNVFKGTKLPEVVKVWIQLPPLNEIVPPPNCCAPR